MCRAVYWSRGLSRRCAVPRTRAAHTHTGIRLSHPHTGALPVCPCASRLCSVPRERSHRYRSRRSTLGRSRFCGARLAHARRYRILVHVREFHFCVRPVRADQRFPTKAGSRARKRRDTWPTARESYLTLSLMPGSDTHTSGRGHTHVDDARRCPPASPSSSPRVPTLFPAVAGREAKGATGIIVQDDW